MTAQRDATEVLTAHQRRDISSCTCGWARLGHSFAGHDAARGLCRAADLAGERADRIEREGLT